MSSSGAKGSATRFSHRLDRLDARFTAGFDRRRRWLLCAFAILYLLITYALARQKLLWNDELFTLYISRVPTLFDIWSIVSTGVEAIPPSFHVVTRLFIKLFGENHVSLRLPEMLGIGAMSLCLFRIVSRRSSTTYGVVAMLIPLVTSAYDYAYEARPYGLVLGFSAASMMCWQSAAEGRPRASSLVGLTAALAAALAMHYYSVLLFAPLAIGEVVRSVARRRLDLPIWLAFGASATPLLVFLGPIRGARHFSTTSWAKPYWLAPVEFYRALLNPAALPLLAILVVMAIYAISRSYDRAECENAGSLSVPFHELAAALGYLAIPLLGVLLAKLVTNAFVDRYVVGAVLGLAILIAWGAYYVLDRRATIGAVLAIVLCAHFVVMQGVVTRSALSRAPADQYEMYRVLRDGTPSNLPIVIASPQLYFQLAYYAPPELAPRLVYLADVAAALHYLGTDVIELGLLEFRRWTPLQIEEYRSYMQAHPRFVVYGSTRPWVWLLRALVKDGARIQVLAQHGGDFVFLVNAANESG